MDPLILAAIFPSYSQVSAEHKRREHDLEYAFEKDILGFTTTEYEALELLEESGTYSDCVKDETDQDSQFRPPSATFVHHR